MEIQQLLVSVMTQHPQMVMQLRSQQHGPHPLQLAMAYRPPQLQLSLYICLTFQWSVVLAYILSCGLVKATHFFPILFSILDLGPIIGGYTLVVIHWWFCYIN